MLWASTAAGSRLASSIEAEDRMCIVILLLLFLLFFLELKNAIWLSQTGFERLCCCYLAAGDRQGRSRCVPTTNNKVKQTTATVHTYLQLKLHLTVV